MAGSGRGHSGEESLAQLGPRRLMGRRALRRRAGQFLESAGKPERSATPGGRVGSVDLSREDEPVGLQVSGAGFIVPVRGIETVGIRRPVAGVADVLHLAATMVRKVE